MPRVRMTHNRDAASARQRMTQPEAPRSEDEPAPQAEYTHVIGGVPYTITLARLQLLDRLESDDEDNFAQIAQSLYVLSGEPNAMRPLDKAKAAGKRYSRTNDPRTLELIANWEADFAAAAWAYFEEHHGDADADGIEQLADDLEQAVNDVLEPVERLNTEGGEGAVSGEQ